MKPHFVSRTILRQVDLSMRKPAYSVLAAWWLLLVKDAKRCLTLGSALISAVKSFPLSRNKARTQVACATAQTQMSRIKGNIMVHLKRLHLPLSSNMSVFQSLVSSLSLCPHCKKSTPTSQNYTLLQLWRSWWLRHIKVQLFESEVCVELITYFYAAYHRDT